MIDDERLVIPAYLRSELDAVDIREVGMGLIDAGFEPVESNIYCVEYYTAGVGSDREVAALPTASEAIVENGSGAFFVTYDGFELEVYIEYTDNLGEPDIHLYGLGRGLRQADVSEADRKRRAETVVDAVEAVAEITDPWGVTSAWHGEGGVSHTMPSSPPAEVSMSRLPWLTVFGLEWCDHLGGRDRLLDTPAWNTRELSTGAVFVRKTELPHEEYRTNGVRDSRAEVAPGEYVFEGWTISDPDELREQMLASDPRTQLDPFRALEDGEHGEDICLCKGHASIVEETAETDYRRPLENDLTLRDRCQVLKVQRRGDAL